MFELPNLRDAKHYHFPALLFGPLSCSLRNRPQVEQLLKYVVEEPPADADDKRLFK